jgi:hypothetical protein
MTSDEAETWRRAQRDAIEMLEAVWRGDLAHAAYVSQRLIPRMCCERHDAELERAIGPIFGAMGNVVIAVMESVGADPAVLLSAMAEKSRAAAESDNGGSFTLLQFPKRAGDS